MGEKTSDVRIALYDLAIASYEAETDDLADANRLVETKAQATIATSGVFIGAVLALAKDRLASAAPIILALIFFAIGLLATAAFVAALSLQVRTSLKPPRGTVVANLARDLGEFATDVDLEERLVAMRLDQLRLWATYSADKLAVHDEKAIKVSYAQGSMIAGVLLASALAMGAVVWQ